MILRYYRSKLTCPSGSRFLYSFTRTGGRCLSLCMLIDGSLVAKSDRIQLNDIVGFMIALAAAVVSRTPKLPLNET